MMPLVSQEAVGTPSIRTRERWGGLLKFSSREAAWVFWSYGKDLGTGRRWWLKETGAEYPSRASTLFSVLVRLRYGWGRQSQSFCQLDWFGHQPRIVTPKIRKCKAVSFLRACLEEIAESVMILHHFVVRIFLSRKITGILGNWSIVYELKLRVFQVSNNIQD